MKKRFIIYKELTYNGFFKLIVFDTIEQIIKRFQIVSEIEAEKRYSELKKEFSK